MSDQKPRYKKQKYNYNETEILAEYRRAVSLSQDEAAKCYGLEGAKRRNMVGDWERGVNHADSRHPEKFLRYLWKCLKLKDYPPEEMHNVWDQVVVRQWKWDPLTYEKARQYLPNAKSLLELLAQEKFKIAPFLIPPRDYDPIGRNNLLKKLKQRLLAGNDVALYGIPGVGKTNLALALAYDPEVLGYYQGGVLWVGLGQQATEASIFIGLGKWAETLGLSQEKIDQLKDIRSRMEAIYEEIGKRKLLLIIDDAWDIKKAQSFQVGGRNCAHLITTRSPEIAWDFAEDGAIEVPPLNNYNSKSLLVKFIPELKSSESQSIIKAVGGLPLSLILIGRYLRLQTRPISEALEDLKQEKLRLEGLDRPIHPLKRSPTLREEESITLQATINISYRILNQKQQAELQALSVFPPNPNTFSKVAALTIAESSPDALSILIKQHGLIQTNGDRYSLHQTINDFLRNQFSDGLVYQRFAEFFTGYVEARMTDYDALDLEATNIFEVFQVASEHDLPANLVRIANVFFDFLRTRGLYELADHYLNQAKQAASSLGDNVGLATILLHLGGIAERSGKYPDAEKYMQEGLIVARNIGHRELTAALLGSLGAISGNQGDLIQAEKFYNEALDLARLADDRRRITGLLANLGVVAVSRRDFVKAEQYWLEALELSRDIEDAEITIQLLANLGAMASEHNDYEKSENYLQEALTLAYKIKHYENISYTLDFLGSVAMAQQDYLKAEKHYREGLNTAKEIGHRWLISRILNSLGEFHLKQQNIEEASQAFLESLPISQNLQAQENTAYTLYGLAQVEKAKGNLAEARRWGQESLTTFEAINHHESPTVKQWLDTLPKDDASPTK